MMKNKDKIHENGLKPHRATIKDVAQRAQVSLATVSRALREPEKTPAKTVNKVRAAVEHLNYVYNATAGSLAKRRSTTIGVLLPSHSYSAFGANLAAIQETCSNRNYACKVALSHFSPEKERQALLQFHEQRIDGIILVGLDSSNLDYMHILESSGVPCITLWEIPDANANYICIDNAKAVNTALRYLIELGHERIGLLLGPMQCAYRSIERMESYKRTLEENNIPFTPELIRSQPPSFLLGKESMREFLRLPEPPTAVFAVNDYLAIGAIRAIVEAGLRVPEHISVCGFDDIDISAYFNPPLTSMKTPCYEMGHMAADAIITSIESQTPLKMQYVLDTELIVRKTCAKAYINS